MTPKDESKICISICQNICSPVPYKVILVVVLMSLFHHCFTTCKLCSSDSNKWNPEGQLFQCSSNDKPAFWQHSLNIFMRTSSSGALHMNIAHLKCCTSPQSFEAFNEASWSSPLQDTIFNDETCPGRKTKDRKRLNPQKIKNVFMFACN